MSLTPALKKGKIGSKSINAQLSDLVALDSMAVADLPDAADYEGHLIHVSDGAAGSPTLAYSDGTDWLRVALGVAVAAA